VSGALYDIIPDAFLINLPNLEKILDLPLLTNYW